MIVDSGLGGLYLKALRAVYEGSCGPPNETTGWSYSIDLMVVYELSRGRLFRLP